MAVESYKEDFLKHNTPSRRRRASRLPPQNELLYSCLNNCGKTYKYRQSMMLHVKFECGKEPQFQCEFCHKKFAHRGSLRNHVGLVHKVIV